ncbi:MAG: acetyltransferase [Planctomycetota bacterium]|nr:MAG: acetyltransferase [Planctomycetota bacterium]
MKPARAGRLPRAPRPGAPARAAGVPLALAAAPWLTLALAGPAAATDRFDPSQSPPSFSSTRWERTERLEDPHPALVQEPFLPLLEHRLPEIVEAFGGDASPPSSQALLHYARGWKEADPELPPVLLVHGAGLTANHCFADRPFEQPHSGLAARLSADRRAVFAITFAHPHGDNVLQAELLADAIARVRHVTGAAKVDLVAHSKGGMSARIYLSNAGREWSTRYRGDVRRYVMLGTPNGGLDVSFAYPNLNYWILQHGVAAPLSFTAGYYYGRWTEWRAQSVYKEGAFPGQAQMLARWDRRYGRTRAKGQVDVDTTYDGGKGQVSVSLGIERAIADGGHFMAHLARHGVDPEVELAVLAGTSPWILGMVGERRGPSDGLLLVASAWDTAALTSRGARLLRKDALFLNHLQLVYDPRANDWVAEVLAQ